MRTGSIFLISSFFFTVLSSKFFSGLHEGDIAVREEHKTLNGNVQDAFLWHTDHNWNYGIVPYYIDEDSIRNQDDMDMIKAVIEDIEAVAKCITFLDLSGKKKLGDHIRIRAHGDTNNPGKGCWSYVGKQGGEQVLNLDQGCMDWGAITHELLHALGQLHEHTRPDRDQYVKIFPENIENGKSKNFEKREKGPDKNQVVYMDASYDMYSLLHYGSNAWSKDGKKKTIEPRNKQYKTIGGTGGMTATDIIELNLRYGCSEIGSPTIIDYIHEVEHRASMESQKFFSLFSELANKHQNLEDEVAEIKALQKETWEMTDNINCWTTPKGIHRGAISIHKTQWTTGNGDLGACKMACQNHESCTGIIWGKGDKTCHLRKNINVSQCQSPNNGYTLHQRIRV